MTAPADRKLPLVGSSRGLWNVAIRAGADGECRSRIVEGHVMRDSGIVGPSDRRVRRNGQDRSSGSCYEASRSHTEGARWAVAAAPTPASTASTPVYRASRIASARNHADSKDQP